ncbi:MAG: acetylxylan esterase, partial [Planctomycetes bacterium]|nr:acetylxylan esterase [Planctomycetota bacterium]
RAYGENIAVINDSFPHWFCKNHRQFGANENALPVDQHMLVALAAPRPVYVASASEDQWADPKGEFLSALHAGPAFELFDYDALPQSDMPEADLSIQGRIGYHMRSGPHDITWWDWQQYLDFADKHL